MVEPIERKSEETVTRLIHDALNGARAIQHTYDDLELTFEVWFSYFMSRVGQRKLLDSMQLYDDLYFNMDGYNPTLLPVASRMIPGMTTIGVDVIKPSLEQIKVEAQFIAPEFILVGNDVADEYDDLLWVLFTVVEQGHPLKGLRYSTALRKGELVYPPSNPNFTDSYADEMVHESARGIFIDTRERVMRVVRSDIFTVDAKGKYST